MKKVLLLTLSSLFLTACEVEIATPETPETEVLSLADISGIWNLDNKSDKAMDEGMTSATPYLLINESGNHNTYVYIDWSNADEASIGTSDCYIHENQSIVDLGNGTFEISNDASDAPEIFSYTIAQDQLMIDGFSYSKSPLQESELMPLCEDHTFTTEDEFTL